ncbi:spastin [Chloropicon primus]|uniref:microtubule-severing ATPase n=2 Tax=Chloropicon primus TaxID=1764295 RepID=A0A5B8MWB1_9CHLO|nr:AAA domain-containing ATPase [Chloropicon primus]UPR03136.1 spastin [Chloropicon primus]|eukprot:QDZ23925.1 AAA domain-containing ATPase [Chloropicon primus]
MLERLFGRSKSSAAASAASSREAEEVQLRRLSEYHALAKDCVSRAVTYEENRALASALSHYKKAVELISEALTLQVPKQAQKGAKQTEELLRWHTSCIDRVKHLDGRARGKTQGRGARRAQGGASTAGRSAPPQPQDRGTSRARAKGGKKDELREMIESEILDASPGVGWKDIAGLEKAKQSLREMVILPATRPDLFKGLRAPTRGLLLYGPPGNGKTMLAKATATESTCTFLTVSASTLTSKWVGEAEKLVRMLFQVANERAPAIIFIDEIDSILSARSSNENESSRRLKTEFLIQFDGVNKSDNQVFVIGASNRPEELDDAVRRRLAKRILIPLPGASGRENVLTNLLRGQSLRISRSEWKWLLDATEGYSASDIKELCHEAAMMSIRELSPAKIAKIETSSLRPINASDFRKALETIKSSVSVDQLRHYEEWTKDFGTSV